MKNYIVATKNWSEVFSGNKTDCNAYLKQALKKGSQPGFLRIVLEKEFLEKANIAREMEDVQ